MKANEQKAVGHTAGPWKSSQCGKLVERDHVLGTPIAQLNPCGAIHPDESEANARLIMCAPDMLEALELVLMTLRQYDIGHERQAEICAIIARAKGEA